MVDATKIMESGDSSGCRWSTNSGRLVGMVTRRDLLKVFLRTDEELRREIIAEALEGLVGVEQSQLRVEVDDGVVTLLGEVERGSLVPA